MTTRIGPSASLQVLGPVALHPNVGVSSVPRLTQPRPLAVLTYLILAHPRRMQSRDTLLALLWPESDQAQGRHALRNVLHSLRKAIGDEALVVGGDGLVGVAPGSVTCDAIELEEQCVRRNWPAALALYQGDLLTGFHVSDAPEFEEWLHAERMRLRKVASSAAAEYTEMLASEGDVVGAIRAAERRVQLAPDEESAQRSLMQLLAQNGERTAAVQVYERFEERLCTAYDAKPSRETRELLRSLRQSSADHHAVPDTDSTRLPDVAAPEGNTSARSNRDRRKGAKASAQPALWAAVIAVALLGFSAAQKGLARAPLGASVFVTPVVNATGDSTATWLGEGFTISLRDQFRKAGWRPVARASGASLVLRGRADSMSGKVRLRLEALPQGALTPVAAAEVLVQPNRLLDAELSVAGQLMGQLRPELAGDSLVAALRRGTDDAAAYRFFLQGWYLWDRRYTGADMEGAAARFDSALAHDPVYADALAARARVHFALAWTGPSPESGLGVARADAERALELDSTSRVALTVLGAIETFRDSMAARLLLERAVALDPDRADTWFLLGLHYGFRGEYASSERALRRARELDPLTPYLNAKLASIQVCEGDLEGALATVKEWRALSIRPELLPVIENQRAWILIALGRWREAIPALNNGFLAESPEGQKALGNARSVEDVDRVVRAEAERRLVASKSAVAVPSVSARGRAVLALMAGHRAVAVTLLLEASRDGDVTMAMACGAPQLHPLLELPEVAEAMRLRQN